MTEGQTYWTRKPLRNGQSARLLVRLPYSRVLIVRKEFTDNGSSNLDALMRAFLLDAEIDDYLTGERVTVDNSEIGRADMETVDEIIEEAFRLYVEWKKAANPKETAATEPESAETPPSDG